MDLLELYNLSIGLLDLPKLSQEVPESRLGYDMIRSKDSHPEKRRIWLLFSRMFPSNDLVLFQL